MYQYEVFHSYLSNEENVLKVCDCFAASKYDSYKLKCAKISL